MNRKPLQKFLVTFSLSASMAMAVPSDSTKESSHEERAKPASSKAKYEALYSEILKTMPQGNRSKVDSAATMEKKPIAKASEKSALRESTEKILADKKRQDIGELPPAVKERVEKAISDIEARKSERKLEFKELEK